MPNTGTQHPETSSHKSTASFKTTKWTTVRKAGEGDDEAKGNALAALCRAYWYPLYVFVRREGHGDEDAKDLTQGFFAKMLERESIGKADQEKGLYRTYLLTALKSHICDEHRKNDAAKRGGGATRFSFDDEDWDGRFLAEPSDKMTPEVHYHRNWAITLLSNAMKRLACEYERRNNPIFPHLQPKLYSTVESGELQEIADVMGMSKDAVTKALSRMRELYREILRDEVSNTVEGDKDEVDKEMAFLLDMLAK